MVIVVTSGSIVLTGIVDPGMVVSDIVIADGVSNIEVLATQEPETCVETIDCNIIVAEVTVAEIVEAGIVEGGIVVPEKVVVYVIVISSPSTLAGIADPVPEAVYWFGIGRVAVFGVEALEYILPVDPLTSVYCPDKRFARSPLDELYAPSTWGNALSALLDQKYSEIKLVAYLCSISSVISFDAERACPQIEAKDF